MAITVEDLYAGLLGRTPDAGGLAYWNSVFGPTVEPAEIEQFRVAAAPEIARQQQAAYQQELAAANVQRVTPAQEVVSAIRSVPVGPSISEQLAQIDGLLAAPQTGRGEAGSETYALNQQVLTLDRFRTALRDAYSNPQLLPQIATQIAESNLDADNKRLAGQFLSDAQARITANPNALIGQYVNDSSRALDSAFGGLLDVNQSNILSLDYNPAEVQEAIRVYQAASGRITPEDALRAAREYDAEDSLNIGKSFNTSQNARGQEGLLTGSYGFAQAIERYNPQTNQFEGFGTKPEKDVFAAQFNANINIGNRLESTAGLSEVGEGFYTKKLGNPGAYDLFAVYYQDPNTGEAVQVGTSTNFNPELSGFKKFLSSTIGQIIIGIGTGLLLPGAASLVGSALGTGTVASSAIAGSLLGAAGSAITGGDILTGALLGGAGGAFSGYIGTQGGLGNVLKNTGFGISDDIAATLNRYVSGNTLASPDDIAAARSTIDAARAAGAIDDATANVARETISNVAEESAALGRAGFRLTPNQVEDFIPTPPGGGTFPNVPTPVPGSGLGTGIGMGGTGVGLNPNAPGIGFNVTPEDFIPSPPGGRTLPPATSVNNVIDTRLPPPVGGGTLPPITPAPNVSQIGSGTGIGSTISGVVDDIVGFVRRNPLESAAVAASVINRPPQAQVIDTSLPAFVYDPAQSMVLPLINQINNAQTPIFAPNFSNLFQRGGLGAGQYLGYDVLNRRGDIPAQTLLGVPTLAVNNIGVPIGQANTGATSLV